MPRTYSIESNSTDTKIILSSLKTAVLRTQKALVNNHLQAESTAFSTVLHLMALFKLQANKTLPYFCSLNSFFQHNKSINLHSLPAHEIIWLVRELYLLTRNICPQSFVNAIPEPILDANVIEDLLAILKSIPKAVFLLDETLLGYVYQLFYEPHRKTAVKEVQKANKEISVSQLIAFTQLYTPHWVIDFLLQNTILPQWHGFKSKANDSSWQYLLPEDLQTPSHSAQELTIIDPACGSGHFLLRAFDLLLSLHLQEGYSPREGTISILSYNLAGADIDPVGLWVTALSLFLKSCNTKSTTNMPILKLARAQEDELSPLTREASGNGKQLTSLGSLSKTWQDGHVLNSKYRVVITNPPYLGRKLLARNLKVALRQLYPDANQDLAAAFVCCGLELLKPGGRLGFITQTSIFYLPTYRNFRKSILEQNRLVSLVELGTRVFPLQTGEKVNSTLLVLQKNKVTDAEIICVDLTEAKEKAKVLINWLVSMQSLGDTQDQKDSCIYIRQQQALLGLRGCAFNYRHPEVFFKITDTVTRLSTHADIRQGLATSNNKRFIRWWWDVDSESIGKRWIPYVKGAGNERWIRSAETVIDWGNNGESVKQAITRAYPYLDNRIKWVVKNEEFYFREGLTFSFVSSKQFAVRKLNSGCIFDVGGSAIFPFDAEFNYWLAYLNSSFIQAVVKLLNPTLNVQVGDLKQLPVIDFNVTLRERLAQMASRCCFLKQELLSFVDTAFGAQVPKIVLKILSGTAPQAAWQKLMGYQQSCIKELSELEQEIDNIVLEQVIESLRLDDKELLELTSLCQLEAQKRPPEKIMPASCGEFAAVVITYAAAMQLQAKGIVVLLDEHSNKQEPATVGSQLGLSCANARWFEQSLGMSLWQYFITRFNFNEKQRTHNSPRYLCLQLPNDKAAILLSSAVLRKQQLFKKFLENSFAGQIHGLEDRVVNAATSVLADLAAKLSQIQDWTGSDFADVAASATVLPLT